MSRFLASHGKAAAGIILSLLAMLGGVGSWAWGVAYGAGRASAQIEARVAAVEVEQKAQALAAAAHNDWSQKRAELLTDMATKVTVLYDRWDRLERTGAIITVPRREVQPAGGRR